MQHKSTAGAMKSVGEAGRFAGYASVFGVVDNQNDRVEAGAFARSLQGRTQEIKLLWQHEMREPIGYFTRLFEDERGLYVEGQLLLEITRAREAYALLKAGVVKGLSIGYTPLRWRIEPQTGIRRLLEVSLWEVSLVTFAANAQASVSVVKSGNMPVDALLAACRRAERAMRR